MKIKRKVPPVSAVATPVSVSTSTAEQINELSELVCAKIKAIHETRQRINAQRRALTAEARLLELELNYVNAQQAELLRPYNVTPNVDRIDLEKGVVIRGWQSAEGKPSAGEGE